jgi:hypothetical protein
MLVEAGEKGMIVGFKKGKRRYDKQGNDGRRGEKKEKDRLAVVASKTFCMYTVGCIVFTCCKESRRVLTYLSNINSKPAQTRSKKEGQGPPFLIFRAYTHALRTLGCVMEQSGAYAIFIDISIFYD